MTHMNESDLLFGFAKSFHDAVDAVAGEAKDCVHAPGYKAFYQYV
jgi:hypothetical protein